MNIWTDEVIERSALKVQYLHVVSMERGVQVYTYLLYKIHSPIPDIATNFPYSCRKSHLCCKFANACAYP